MRVKYTPSCILPVGRRGDGEREERRERGEGQREGERERDLVVYYLWEVLLPVFGTSLDLSGTPQLPAPPVSPLQSLGRHQMCTAFHWHRDESL